MAGGLGSGEAGDISLTRSTEEYITFEIKLPSVQMTTLAMLGLIYHVVYGRIPVPFSLQLRNCCNQGLGPADSQEVARKRGRP